MIPRQDVPPETAAEIAARAASLGPWWHDLHLPGGVRTRPDHPLGDFPGVMWRRIAPHLPEDLSGCSVLDVGCNSGFYSFELARRGARVVAMDMDPHYLHQASWLRSLLGFESQVELRQAPVYGIGRWGESFDIVLFLGVLYHLRYPLLALDLLARCTRRLMVCQTLTMPGEPPRELPVDLDIDDRLPLAAPGWPRMAFIEHRFADDPTNWWIADRACFEAMLRSSGMRLLHHIEGDILLCEPRPLTSWLDGHIEAELASVMRP